MHETSDVCVFRHSLQARRPPVALQSSRLTDHAVQVFTSDCRQLRVLLVFVASQSGECCGGNGDSGADDGKGGATHQSTRSWQEVPQGPKATRGS